MPQNILKMHLRPGEAYSAAPDPLAGFGGREGEGGEREGKRKGGEKERKGRVREKRGRGKGWPPETAGLEPPLDFDEICGW